MPIGIVILFSVSDLLHNDGVFGDEVRGNIELHIEAHNVVAVDIIDDLVADVHGLLDSSIDGSSICLSDTDRADSLGLALDLHVKLGRSLWRSVLNIPVLGLEIELGSLAWVCHFIDVANA